MVRCSLYIKLKWNCQKNRYIQEAFTGLQIVLRLTCGTHLLLFVFNVFSMLFLLFWMKEMSLLYVHYIYYLHMIIRCQIICRISESKQFSEYIKENICFVSCQFMLMSRSGNPHRNIFSPWSNMNYHFTRLYVYNMSSSYLHGNLILNVWRRNIWNWMQKLCT